MKRLVATLIILAVIICYPLAARCDLKPDWPLTASQKNVLYIAYFTAIEVGIRPGLLQGISMQETRAGLTKWWPNPHFDAPDMEDRYFGTMQMKLGALRDAAKSAGVDISYMSRTELADRLQNDDPFAIFFAAHYLKFLIEYFEMDEWKAVLAYNVGLGTVRRNGFSVDPYGYVDGVCGFANDMAEFNAKNGLTPGSTEKRLEELE